MEGRPNRKTVADDGRDEFLQSASGPVMAVFQEASATIRRKVGERPVLIDGLAPGELQEWLHAAFLESAIRRFPEADAEVIATRLDVVFAKVAKDRASNADGGRRMK